MARKITDDDLRLANRRGYTLGLTLAEIMLIILAVLLLFLIRRNDIIEELGGQNVVDEISTAFEEQPEARKFFQDNPQEIEEWVRLILAEESFTQEEIEEILEESERLSAQNEILQAANNSLNEEVIAYRRGGTTNCTYFYDADGLLRSQAIGLITIDNNRVTYEGALISEEDRVFDSYGDPFDMSSALMVMQSLEVGAFYSYEDFYTINERLNVLGDAYASDTRARCRFPFDYMLADSLDADLLDQFHVRVWRGSNITPEQTFESLPESEFSEINLPIENTEDGNTIDPAFAMPNITNSITPTYPENARRLGLVFGEVDLRYDINEEGIPINIEVVSSSSGLFESAAINAMRRWRFEATGSVYTNQTQRFSFQIN